MDKEGTIETSYMVDVGSFETKFHKALLHQFTLICFFSPYLVMSGIIGYVVNLLMICLTMRIYLNWARRPLSIRMSSIGGWNKLYTIVANLGLLMNILIIVKIEDEKFSLSRVLGTRKEDLQATRSRIISDFLSNYVYVIMLVVLLLKFSINYLIPELPEWIRIDQNNTKLAKKKAHREKRELIAELKKLAVSHNIISGDGGLEEDRSIKAVFENDSEQIVNPLEEVLYKESEIVKRYSKGDSEFVKNIKKLKVNLRSRYLI